MNEAAGKCEGSNSTPPQPSTHAAGDARMEVVMGRLLQVGVLVSAIVVTVGGAMYVTAQPEARVSYRAFVARPLEVRHLSAMFAEIGRGEASAIIELGILVLVATPICRVLLAVIAFAAERDRLYVAISLTVLAVLLFGMLRTS